MLIIGHRGARGEAPENTVAGFKHALNTGVLDFELDLVLTKDKALAVIHDENTLRTTGIEGLVAKLNAEELVALDARTNTPGWRTPCPIPMLPEVIKVCPNDCTFQLEVKSDTTDRLKCLVCKLAEYLTKKSIVERVTVTSKSMQLLKLMRKALPEVSLGYVAEHPYPFPLRTARTLGCDLLVINYRICYPMLVKDAHRHGISVSVWTVNATPEMQRLADMGVDSIITDYPTRAMKWFRQNSGRA